MVDGFLVGSWGNLSAVEEGAADGRAGNAFMREEVVDLVDLVDLVDIIDFAGVPQGLVFLLDVGMV